MSSAEKYVPRYRVSDYQHWEGDWELVEGVAVSMSPSPFGPHERAISELSREFGNALLKSGSDCRTYAGLDWVVSDDTVVRPDLMVVCGQQPERHLEKAPVIVVEVLSPSTRQLDTGSKRRIYQDHGVQTYVIIDVVAKSVEVKHFAAQQKTEVSETLKLSIDGTEIEIPVANIFR